MGNKIEAVLLKISDVISVLVGPSLIVFAIILLLGINISESLFELEKVKVYELVKLFFVFAFLYTGIKMTRENGGRIRDIENHRERMAYRKTVFALVYSVFFVKDDIAKTKLIHKMAKMVK